MRRSASHQDSEGRPPRRRRRGAAAVEAASILPLLVIMVLGTLELGRAYEARAIIADAARQAARLASTGRFSPATIRSRIAYYLVHAGLPVIAPTAPNVQLTFENLDRPSVTDPQLADSGERLRVTVSIPYRDNLWTSFFFTDSSTRLSISTVWASTLSPN